MVTTLFVLWLFIPDKNGTMDWFPDKAFTTAAQCEHYQMHNPPVEKWKCVKYRR
jgi:hypothetical protein